MTEIQDEIFAKVNELLKEHFEGSLVVAVDETDEGRITTLQYNGGLLEAIGMARATARKLEEHQVGSLVLFKSDDCEEENEEC